MLGIKKRDTKQVFKAIAHQQGVSVSEVKERIQPERNGLSDSDMELLQLLKSLTPEMKAMLLKQSASK